MLTWLRKNTKNIILAVAVLFAGSMFYGLGYQGLMSKAEKRTDGLVKVNGKELDPLRFQEILNRVAQGLGKEAGPSEMALIESIALGQAIDFTLMLGEADKKVKVSGGEIDAAIDNIMRQQKVPSKRELEKALKQMGLSPDKFRRLVRDDIAVQKLSRKLQEEVRVMPEDFKEIAARGVLLTAEIEAKVLREKQETSFRRWFSQVKGAAKIEIISPVLKGHDLRFRGLLKEAAEEYKKGAAENPANPYLHVYLGDIYAALGQKDLALSEYERAIGIDGSNPDLYILLGQAQEKAERKELASGQYRKASLVAGDNRARHERLLKLFKNLKLPREAAREKAELKRIEKKEKFEKELKGGK